MQVGRLGQMQVALQQDLSRRVVGQVFAANDVRDTLRRVVHHNGQLVRKQAVCAQYNEIANLARDMLLLGSQAAVCPLQMQG